MNKKSDFASRLTDRNVNEALKVFNELSKQGAECMKKRMHVSPLIIGFIILNLYLRKVYTEEDDVFQDDSESIFNGHISKEEVLKVISSIPKPIW